MSVELLNQSMGKQYVELLNQSMGKQYISEIHIFCIFRTVLGSQ